MFYEPLFVAICYRNNGKLIHRLSKEFLSMLGNPLEEDSKPFLSGSLLGCNMTNILPNLLCLSRKRERTMAHDPKTVDSFSLLPLNGHQNIYPNLYLISFFFYLNFWPLKSANVFILLLREELWKVPIDKYSICSVIKLLLNAPSN